MELELFSELLEGARVLVTEGIVDQWVRVRAENGAEGWVPVQFLVPIAP
jgi:SH3-like domain-containing protein